MKSEIRIPKSERRPKVEGRSSEFKVQSSKFKVRRGGCATPISDFGFRPSFGFRISAFGFRARSRRAFTLLEVMVALLIFFMAIFSILGLVSNVLRNARALQEVQADAGILAAQLSITNKLYETSDSGGFSELGRAYHDYSWTRDINEVGTNGLFEADFIIRHQIGRRPVETKMSVLFFRPESPPGGGGVPIGRP